MFWKHGGAGLFVRRLQIWTTVTEKSVTLTAKLVGWPDG